MVSYALPALIAIGQVLHARNPSANPLARAARGLARAPTLRELAAIQPASGGYLEATPLTSFVVASLIGCGHAEHAVVRAGVRFLADSVRADGSWPIDTNLATWLSALAVDALAADGSAELLGGPTERARLVAWFLAQQTHGEHRYTHAAPGGWAWTDRAGGVPDADDTSGVVLALHTLARTSPEARSAAAAGLRWLAGLQNRDGGVPTFCRGWSGLPFDRSTSDISAHALRASAAWEAELAPPPHLVRGIVAYLVRTQHVDGSWLPLWFGSQHEPELHNPLYGTARVLAARALLLRAGAAEAVARGERWLTANQNDDGSFGARRGLPATIEETALGLGALAEADGPVAPALERAVAWLVERTDAGHRFDSAPIGLYFARLWYAEQLYPLIFSVAGLARARRRLRGSAP
jgi:squalene-hopene/tetraprenyl-beta-curcumene cyclase